ncbi:hypothetical protein GcC1_026029 [Golovinomyces cichoracearum]|uniref:Uncharacterized protein n=1 Tax=Golovinomyces cichoracearum TaxID=62708 RepID=A0A420J3Q8_9PEZI|nr:hypothetical protein GcC1_026029 [Golovinomyces cichoracearum]
MVRELVLATTARSLTVGGSQSCWSMNKGDVAAFIADIPVEIETLIDVGYEFMVVDNHMTRCNNFVTYYRGNYVGACAITSGHIHIDQSISTLKLCHDRFSQSDISFEQFRRLLSTDKIKVGASKDNGDYDMYKKSQGHIRFFKKKSGAVVEHIAETNDDGGSCEIASLAILKNRPKEQRHKVSARSTHQEHISQSRGERSNVMIRDGQKGSGGKTAKTIEQADPAPRQTTSDYQDDSTVLKSSLNRANEASTTSEGTDQQSAEANIRETSPTGGNDKCGILESGGEHVEGNHRTVTSKQTTDVTADQPDLVHNDNSIPEIDGTMCEMSASQPTCVKKTGRRASL